MPTVLKKPDVKPATAAEPLPAAMQQKLRGKTLRRLRVVKPHTDKSLCNLASDILDSGLQVAAEKHIPMPEGCEFEPLSGPVLVTKV